jgi:ribonuclease D
MGPTKPIDNARDLGVLARALSGSTLIAIDTEFVRERTYYPRPYLLQLAWGDEVACVDLMTLGGVGVLADMLFSERVTKVFHAARQDLELFFAMCGQVPAPIYDTQVAGGVLGFPDQSGYGPLVEAVLGVRLDKGHARTDWTRRPLSNEQLRYAMDDVRYLLPMREDLERRLAALGRQEWAAELCQELADPALYAPDPAGAWRRVKSWRQLEGPALARLQALAAWREEQAVDRDRPRKWILGDESLLELARRNPLDEKAVALAGVPPAVARRQGRAITERLAALPGDAEPHDVPADDRLPRSEARFASRLGRLVDETAERASVAPAILATRAELKALVAGRRDLRVLRGWRRELIGDRLLALVEEAEGSMPGQ